MEYPGRKIEGRQLVHKKKLLITINYSAQVDFESAVFVQNIHNFSNFILQLCNAIRFCEENGINAIYIKNNARSRQLIPYVKEFTSSSFKSITFKISNEIPSAFILFSGNFFYSGAIKDLAGRLIRGIPYFELLTEFQLSPKSSNTHEYANTSNFSRVLTVHIRSGDIFEEKHPHPGYGQPPLSYYKWCIKNYNPSKVVLVYQNLSNPIIEPLQSWIESESIDYKIQTSAILRDDVQELIHGNSFVIGNGTFMLGVLALAKNVNRVYLFGNSAYSLLSQELPDITEIIKVKDSDKIYSDSILNNNWQNKDEQRNLMLNYPIENIIAY